MNEGTWKDLGPVDDLPDGGVVLRKSEDGQRFACVRRGTSLHVIDDRCPHEGYPLSQGDVRDGVLTCAWHNWKFDVASGRCDFGGEGVRSYPCRVVEGRLEADVYVDPELEVARVRTSLAEALLDNAVARALRDGLRVDGLVRGGAWQELVRVAAVHAEYGFEHDLAVTADLITWVDDGWLELAPAFSVAATAVGEGQHRLPARASHSPEEVAPDAATDPSRIFEDLRDERKEAAEARVRACVREHGAERTVVEGLLPYVAWHNMDYGHGAIFTAKALELSRRMPAVAEEVLASVCVGLGWATRETTLPPWKRTARALEEVDRIEAGDGPLAERAEYERAVLAGETEAIEATLAALRTGASPRALLLAVARAAAERLFRFDAAWEARVDAPVTILGVSHALTFAESAWVLAGEAERAGWSGAARASARLALLGATFVGKLRRADRADPIAPEADGSGVGGFRDALERRDVDTALAAVRGLDAAARADVYRAAAEPAALSTWVRPIFAAHAVKTTEALRRLDAVDAEAGEAYVRALCWLLVPRRGERNHLRVAHIAEKFLEDGRPPPDLF